MSYLGQVELKSSDIRRVDVTSSTSATHTLTWTPPSEQSLIVTINGVKQQNNYTISGTTLTLDSALIASDELEVVGILDIGVTNIPADDSITNAMVKSSAAIAQSKLATIASDALSGDMIDGGTISDFASTGIDDNAASTAVIIDSAGAMTKTLQPAFFAYNQVAELNVTGNGVLYTIICETEIFDQGADYSTVTGVFTAPVSGRYFLQGQVATDAQTTTNTDATFQLNTSNKSTDTYYNPGNMEGPSVTGQCSISASGIFDMDASDTCIITLDTANDSDYDAIDGRYFSGCLIA